MASTATITKNEHDELCCGYSALILQDAGVEITSENITKLITESNNEVEVYWPALFAKAVGGLNLTDLLSSVGSSGPAGPAEGAEEGAGAAAVVEEEEPQEEEADVNMGDIFGGEDDY